MAGWLTQGMVGVPNSAVNTLTGTEKSPYETGNESGVAPETFTATTFQAAAVGVGLIQNIGTASAGSVTLNTFSGTANTGALSTAAGSTATLKIVNSNAVTGTPVVCGLANGSNTTLGATLTSAVIANSGTVTVTITNNGSAALNGSLLVPFLVGTTV